MGKVVVTRQDRVVVYQMEEREVEHTWYSINAYINFSTHKTLLLNMFSKKVCGLGGRGSWCCCSYQGKVATSSFVK